MNNEILSVLNELKRYAMVGAKKMLTAEEAAFYLGVKTTWVYQLIAAREIPHYKPNGRRVYFDRDDLDAWLKRCKVESAEAASNAAEIRDYMNR